MVNPMNRTRSRLVSLLSTVCLIGLSLIASAADRPVRPLKNIDIEISGAVIDSDTKMPVSGAYVVVFYGSPSKNPSLLYDHCVKVKGTYVDVNGKFSFAAERLDNMVLDSVYAVASNYYYGRSNPAGRGLVIELMKWDLSDSVSHDSIKQRLFYDQDQLLSKASLDCWRAPTREDAAAAIPALKILKESFLKYYLKDSGREGVARAENIHRIIHLLEQLPTNASTSN